MSYSTHLSDLHCASAVIITVIECVVTLFDADSGLATSSILSDDISHPNIGIIDQLFCAYLGPTKQH